MSATGLAPTTGAIPFVSFQPENGQTDVSIRPKIRVQFAESDFNNVLPGSVRCRLDGRLLAPQDQFSTIDFVHQIPVTEALTPGSHRCDLEFALLHGGILRTSITFNVTSTLPAPRQLRAAAGQYRVALRWDAEALAWARGGFRVYRTPLGGTPLLISGPSPVSQPCFVDTAPLTNATYTVAGLDAVGAEGPASSPLPVIFPGTIPPAAGPIAVQAQSLENPSRIALDIQDSTPGFTLWRIEASASASGPFADVLNGELTSLDLWPVPRPFEETRQWFRVTPLNVDGLAGAPVVVGPLALPMPWPAVTGVTALLETNTTPLIQWDPYTHGPIIGYRVERQISGQWTLAADVGPATTWADTLPSAGGLRQWRVSARFADGASPASPAVGLSWQPRTLQPGTIRFAASSLTGAEDTPLSVDIIREGGSDGPAFVTWSTWGWSGTAMPDYDYTALAGLLIFAPGETQKTVQIPLLPDNYLEQPNENFYAYIKNVEGGPALGEPSTTELFILDGPELSWESTWLYGLEDTNTTQVQFTVKLSAPANH
ncbi:MAG: Calx-beta domain-containing protein, partial [Armatimonadia bacterium]